MSTSPRHPRLRPVEAFPAQQDGQDVVVIHDPAGWALGPMTVSAAGLFLLSLMDGEHDRDDLRRDFLEQFQAVIPEGQIEQLIEQLDTALYLDSARFAQHMQRCLREYAASPVRPFRTDGLHAEQWIELARQVVAEIDQSPAAVPAGRLRGLVAPHLDYPRGMPCYVQAYRQLRAGPPPRRVVILGTNHFGTRAAAVATGKDFETPLGVTRTDRAYLDRLSARCGTDLCAGEFDHVREHSVELQVLLLQAMFGAEAFSMVPILCPDPCGPIGTAPHNGDGADLAVLAEALAEAGEADGADTLLLAGADLSHVGRRFGMDRDLSSAFLQEVESKDREVLEPLRAGRVDAFLRALTVRGNDTSVCSAGCLYTLRSALPDARGELLGYHQALDLPADTCVSCAALAYWTA